MEYSNWDGALTEHGAWLAKRALAVLAVIALLVVAYSASAQQAFPGAPQPSAPLAEGSRWVCIKDRTGKTVCSKTCCEGAQAAAPVSFPPSVTDENVLRSLGLLSPVAGGTDAAHGKSANCRVVYTGTSPGGSSIYEIVCGNP